MRSSIVVAAGYFADMDKHREYDRLMTEWDEHYPTLKETRHRIKTRYMWYDPIVLREFSPMKDAWEWTTFLRMEGKLSHYKVRLDADAPNLTTDDPAIDPQVIMDKYAKLLEVEGVVM